jgi:hypothetical protein
MARTGNGAAKVGLFKGAARRCRVSRTEQHRARKLFASALHLSGGLCLSAAAAAGPRPLPRSGRACRRPQRSCVPRGQCWPHGRAQRGRPAPPRRSSYLCVCIITSPTPLISMYFNHVIEAVGHTPLVKLNKVTAGIKGHHFGQSGVFQPRQFGEGPHGRAHD